MKIANIYWIYLISFFLPTITFSQNVAVELEKMNVFYRILNNPINVAIENYPCDKIIIKSMYGRISSGKDSCHYNYNPANCTAHYDTLFFGINDNGNEIWLDTISYRIKDVLESVYTTILSYHFSMNIEKDKLKKLVELSLDTMPEIGDKPGIYIRAPLINFDIDLDLPLIRYSVCIERNGTVVYREENINSDRFSNGLNEAIKLTESKDIIRFYNVTIIYCECEKEIKDFIINIK